MSESNSAKLEKRTFNGGWRQVVSSLEERFRAKPTLANARMVLRESEAISEWQACLAPIRVAILRSFTVEPILPLLEASALFYGFKLSVQVGQFNTYVQEIVDPASELYRFKPDAVFIAIRTPDIVPELWDRYELGSGDQAVERAVASLESLVKQLRAHSSASVILHNFEQPIWPVDGLIGEGPMEGQSESIRQLNRRLRRVASENTGVYVLDYDGLVARHGRLLWHDESKWQNIRLPISSDCLIHLADEYVRFLVALGGRTCKAIAVDLDNTLWGGIIAEDGFDGIRVGPDPAGIAYQALQRVLLSLNQRGILLGVCSKNNREDGLRALEEHPGMLLRPSHFAALKINWNDKSDNLRQLAKDLNIGLDAIAFIDDNPVERAEVRSLLPEVKVLDLPADPAGYAPAVLRSPWFERLTLSQEDRERTLYYLQEQAREQVFQNSASLESFYHSLEIEADVHVARPNELARVAQLTQKTNQFNVTTRRYSEQEIREIAADPHQRIYTIQVKDRFGDCGLIGVAIVRCGVDWEIDTFLLSCRAIGRRIETALLARIARDATTAGVAELRGSFISTKKNGPAAEFFPRHGFELVEEKEDTKWFCLNLAMQEIATPEFIQCGVTT